MRYCCSGSSEFSTNSITEQIEKILKLTIKMQNTLKKTLIHAFLTISGIYITHIGKDGDFMSNSFDWRTTAACRDKDPELFFPIGSASTAVQQLEEAKAVCRSCNVASECLKCALETNQDYGVWGGLSEDERRTLKRRALRALRSHEASL